MKIVVAGATGVLGTEVVAAVRAAGHDPVALSRAVGVDLRSGNGLTERLRGAGAVVDVSSTTETSARGSVAFFAEVTRNLLRAEVEAGVPHHVAISIVGAAEVDAGYYAGKAAQERALQTSPVGWSLLRATQFHEFVPQLVRRGRLGPLRLVPAMRSQPVAAAEVAERLVAIASGEPRGLEPDLAGPREERMVDLVRRYRATSAGHGQPGAGRFRVVELPLPGRFGRSLRDGSLLPVPGASVGRQTFDEWLAARALAAGDAG